MSFERTLGPGKVHASTIGGVGPTDATLLSPGIVDQAATPRLGSMLPPPTAAAPIEIPRPGFDHARPHKLPPSAWKRPIVMHGEKPVAPTVAPAQQLFAERSLPSTRPPPPLSIPPATKTSIPPWAALALGAASVFVVFAIALLIVPSSRAPSKAPASAAPPPSVAAWTLEDAPGVSVNPVPALPVTTPSPTTQREPTPPSTSTAVSSAKHGPPKPVSSNSIQNVR